MHLGGWTTTWQKSELYLWGRRSTLALILTPFIAAFFVIVIVVTAFFLIRVLAAIFVFPVVSFKLSLTMTSSETLVFPSRYTVRAYVPAY